MYDNIWLMDPDRYRVRQENHAVFMKDPVLLAESSKYTAANPAPYQVQDGVAVINFYGPITNKNSYFSFLFGEAVLPDIRYQIRAADADPAITAILLRFDTPGGPPAGLSEFTDLVNKIGKRTIGYCDGMAASGGFWAASALDALVVSSTASLGSIGVIAVLTEITKLADREGITHTVIRAGKYKALGNRYEVLTTEGRANVQDEVDTLYSVFVDAVAENLGITVKEAMKMADGQTFIGQQAVDMGLADKVGSFDDAINMALNDNNSNSNREEAMDIKTVSELKEAFPELCATLSAEAVAGVKVPDVSVESDRVMALASAVFGEEDGKKLAGIVATGVTLEQYQSIAGTVKAKEVPKVAPTAAEGILKALLEDGTQIPKTQTEEGAPKTFMEAWKQIKDADKCDTKTAMSAAARKYPELYKVHAGRTEGVK